MGKGRVAPSTEPSHELSLDSSEIFGREKECCSSSTKYTLKFNTAKARVTFKQTYVSSMRGKEDLSLAGLVGSDPHQTIPSANDNTPAGNSTN